MGDLEAERRQNMQANAQLLASLGLQANSKPSSTNSHFPKNERSKKSTGKRKHAAPVEGARKSARLRDQPAQHASAEFNDDNETSATHPQSIPPAIRKLDPIALPEPSDLEDYDPNYRAPFPSRHDNGIFSFQDGYEHFAPNLSPREIFQKGAFGGGFWRNTYSKALRKPLSTEDKDVYPTEWWQDIDVSLLTTDEYDIEKNAYGVKAGQSLAEWEAAGWIRHWDPRGWMQWYCNFFTGRRTPDDHRQIKRWLGVCGPTGRFKTSLLKKINQNGGESALHDRDVAPVLRQTLLHWACEITLADWERVRP